VSQWPNKYVIGLTGNIAVGKSVVRQMLQHSGAYTIDADSLAHQTMMPGAPAYKPVVSTFGQMIVGEDGRINRAMLGNIVFSNAEALKKLEAITHPVIRQAINVLVGRAKQRVVVIEAIKLLDGPLHEVVDAVWVVNSTPQTQYKRLIEKRKMSQEQAKQRMLSQGKQADKVAKADVVIQNDGNVEETWKQVQLQWSEIKKKFAGGAPAPATPKPAADKPATPAPAAAPATPEPAPAKASKPAGDLEIKRGMPNNAELIAKFISAESGSEVSRMDVMMSFGEKSYLFGEDASGKMVTLIGWTVENLVTSMDDFYISFGVNVESTVTSIVDAVEEASKELQSEVGFIFLPKSTKPEIIKSFQTEGYAETTLSEVRIPVWREAVETQLSSNSELVVLWKQLRQDRVLQPI